jgi:hypothetical protein
MDYAVTPLDQIASKVNAARDVFDAGVTRPMT